MVGKEFYVREAKALFLHQCHWRAFFGSGQNVRESMSSTKSWPKEHFVDSLWKKKERDVELNEPIKPTKRDVMIASLLRQRD